MSTASAVTTVLVDASGRVAQLSASPPAGTPLLAEAEVGRPFAEVCEQAEARGVAGSVELARRTAGVAKGARAAADVDLVVTTCRPAPRHLGARIRPGRQPGSAVVTVHDLTAVVAAERAAIGPTSGVGDGTHPTIRLVVGPDRQVVELSAETERIVGLGRDGINRRGGLPNVHPADRELALQALTDVEDGDGEVRDLVVRVQRGDGRWRHLAVRLEDRRDDPDVGGVVITGDDVSEEHRRQVTARLEGRLLRHIPASLAVTDDGGIVLYWNDRSEELYGWSAAEAIGRHIDDLGLRNDDDALDRPRWSYRVPGGSWEDEYDARRRDGSLITVHASLEEVHDAELGFDGVIGAAVDISERRAVERQLEEKLLHDPVTGLANRALATELLDQLMASVEQRPERTAAVLFCDIDDFAEVNDALGRAAGDEMLRAVAELVESCAGEAAVVAHVSGDEFLIGLEVGRPREAVALAERILQRLGELSDPAGSFRPLTASIGVAVAVPGEEPERVIRDADAAMYRAKALGKGRIELFDRALRRETKRRQDLEHALRAAVEDGELVVHWQPQVEIRTGRIVGAEALVRWDRPGIGLVGPGEFIPLAEETGLITDVGAWVLTEACRTIARWRRLRAARPLLASVNISARQLSDPGLPELVARCLRDHTLEPRSLCLEITESVLMDEGPQALESLDRLARIGVLLSADDFGTGYSSLRYLRSLPLTALKVDQSFVAGLGTDTGDTAIVEALVRLADALGLHVVAEGVETAQQRDELVRLGCRHAQGFLWSRPVPADELEAVLLAEPR